MFSGKKTQSRTNPELVRRGKGCGDNHLVLRYGLSVFENGSLNSEVFMIA